MARKPNLIVGLDIGTTQVRCLVGSRPTSENNQYQIIGQGQAEHEGVTKGVITDYKDVAQAIDLAIQNANSDSGHTIGSVTVNLNGIHLKSYVSEGRAATSNDDRLVTKAIVNQADKNAQNISDMPHKRLVYFYANDYYLDNKKINVDPIGMQTEVLKVHGLVLVSGINEYDMLEKACNEADVSINSVVTSSVAGYHATFKKMKSDSGVAIVDIGYNTTNLVIVKEGKIEHIFVIPQGGHNITSDISITLRTDLDLSEHLKVEHVDLTKTEPRGSKTVQFMGHNFNYTPQMLNEIVTARLEELADIILEQIKEADFDQQLAGGVILTGGGSQIKGIENVFKNCLELPVVPGQLQNYGGLLESIQDRPEWITAAGLMAIDSMHANRSSNFSPNIFGWFRNLFR